VRLVPISANATVCAVDGSENRLDFYHRADRFLARDLGGRAEQPTS